MQEDPVEDEIMSAMLESDLSDGSSAEDDDCDGFKVSPVSRKALPQKATNQAVTAYYRNLAAKSMHPWADGIPKSISWQHEMHKQVLCQANRRRHELRVTIAPKPVRLIYS